METPKQAEITEAVAPVDAPAEAVEASTDDHSLIARLAAAEAENSVLMSRIDALEAETRKAAQAARLSATRAKALELGRAGKLANVRQFIELRTTSPAELTTGEDVERLVDAVIECATGTGIHAGRLSVDVLTDDTAPIRTDADLERRAVELAAEKEIPYSQARRLALREVK